MIPRRRLVIFVAIVLIVVAWLLSSHWHKGPVAAFDDMLRTNLSTAGVTRVVSQQGQGLTITQYTQLNLGAMPTAHALTVFHEKGGTLTTEEISNPHSDFVRYQRIQSALKSRAGRPLDFSSVLGKWAQLQPGDSMSTALTSGLFNQSLTGVLPVADLNAAQRDRLLAYIQSSHVFSYDASQVKTVTLAGRRVYQYTLSVKPVAYITLMQGFEKLVGVKAYANVDPATFRTAKPIPLIVDVDARSHLLAQLTQPATGRIERYEGFGISRPTVLPKATITTAELTSRLATLQRQ